MNNLNADNVNNAKLDMENKAVSVSLLSQQLKNCIEGSFTKIYVKGEIGACKQHSSGHTYFSLKDEHSVIDCVRWRGQSSNVKLEEGMQVIIIGKVTTYGARSKYQLIVQDIICIGAGNLLIMLEKLKQKLRLEGVFDHQKRLKMPFIPQKIGIVTSLTGAVIRDMIHRLRERMPMHVIIYPVNVQGDGAETEIISAIKYLDNNNDVDLIIIARGGGSMEDLWTFNDEGIARTVAKAKTPIISAIGHETDTTLIDYAAFRRAPTPTAAAEIISPNRLDILQSLDSSKIRLKTILGHTLEAKTLQLQVLSGKLPKIDDYINQYYQRLDEIQARSIKTLNARISQSITKLQSQYNLFHVHMKNNLERNFQRLSGLTELLNSLCHKNVLARGYAIIKNENNTKVIAKKAGVSKVANIHFIDGYVRAVIEKGQSTNQSMTRNNNKKAKLETKDQDQLSLF